MSADSDNSVSRTEIAKDASASAHETVAGQSDRRGFLKGVAAAAAATLGLGSIAGSVSASRSWGQAYKVAKQHESTATVTGVLQNQDELVADIAEETGLSENEVTDLDSAVVSAASMESADGHVAAVTAKKDIGDESLLIQTHPEENEAFALIQSADGESELVETSDVDIIGPGCELDCDDCRCREATVCNCSHRSTCCHEGIKCKCYDGCWVDWLC
ncbi:hypothetical protein Huta_1381 [Halorhabdus utahensis DSM 12940]|uniref:Twin-arginine translocation signal domain-containing protein n=1 Tax=Halorhabdus utahensis (strain DSM 12940 / JCM 11049 / AX-2) TaxID=519442 RepID=C7NNF7_HALUD|nr:twin-arginine translocation signal domain-containing protein [Halorhabdus utahensis]ACV11557.1 hypothetical protein Huta_1381 [Halorhabdus utahensis DSM 12940]